MIVRKIVFWVAVVVFLIAACGIDNGGWWYIALLGSLGVGCLVMVDLNKEERDYILRLPGTDNDEENDFKF